MSMNFSQPIRKIRPNPHDRTDERLPFTIIGPSSPRSYREAVRLLAEDFANGAHFSPAPYEVDEAEHYGSAYAGDRVLLFSTPLGPGKIRCFGAVGLRWKTYDEVPTGGWFITWAWFHPKQQRQGHLSKAWPSILRLFPNACPDPPITEAMNSFLDKVQFQHPLRSALHVCCLGKRI